MSGHRAKKLRPGEDTATRVGVSPDEAALEQLARTQDSRLAEIRNGIIPANRSQDQETKDLLVRKTDALVQIGLAKNDLRLELKTSPAVVEALKGTFRYRRIKPSGDVGPDPDGKHRGSLFKSVSLVLTGNADKVRKHLLEAAISHMWKHRQQYEVAVQVSWPLNHNAASNVSASAMFAKYLVLMSQSKMVFPYYPVVHALAHCLNIAIWIWNINNSNERAFHIVSPSNPSRTVYLVRDRMDMDHSVYYPLVPVDIENEDENEEGPPTASFSQITDAAQGQQPNLQQVLDLPFIGRKTVEEVLDDWIPLEDTFFMRLTREGDFYVLRKYRGHRLGFAVESEPFPKSFPVEYQTQPEPTSITRKRPNRKQRKIRRSNEPSRVADATWFRAELTPSLENIDKLVGSFRSHILGSSFFSPGDKHFASLADKDVEFEALSSEIKNHFSKYKQHNIPVLFSGETKAGKSTAINNLVRACRLSEDDWKAVIGSLPAFQDSGLGADLDDQEIDDFMLFDGREDDVLPSSSNPTTTRHAQIVVASSGEVSFAVTFWTLDQLDQQLSLIESCFTSARDDWEDDDRQGSVENAVKEAFENNSEILLTAGELVWMLDLNNEGELWRQISLDLPNAKRDELRGTPPERSYFFRKNSLFESMKAMRNEYLRVVVGRQHQGFVRTATISVPLYFPFRIIDIPGLQARDPFGYGIAIRGLKGGYGDFDSVVFVFKESLESGDFTYALGQAKLGHQLLKRPLQIIDLIALDKVFTTIDDQQIQSGRKVTKHVKVQSEEHEKYLLDMMLRDRATGIGSELQNITEDERARREELVRQSIRHVAINVTSRVNNPNVGKIEELLKVLTGFTAQKWKSRVDTLFRQTITAMSVVTSLMFKFASVDSGETVKTLIYHMKALAESYGRPGVTKVVKNQVEEELRNACKPKLIKDAADVILAECGPKWMNAARHDKLKAAYTKPGAKRLTADLRHQPVSKNFANNATAFVIGPLSGQLTDRLVNTMVASLQGGIDRVLKGLGPVLDSQFDAGIDSDDPEQRELAKSILTDKRDEFYSKLKKTCDTILENFENSSKEALDDSLEEETNDQLGNLFNLTRALKRKAPDSVNQTRLKNLIVNGDSIATGIAREVSKTAQQLVEEVKEDLIKALMAEFDDFRNQFAHMTAADISGYVNQQQSEDFIKKTVEACKLLLELWDEYTRTFLQPVAGSAAGTSTGEAQQPPVLLQGASSLAKQEEMLHKYRAFLARHLPN